MKWTLASSLGFVLATAAWAQHTASAGHAGGGGFSHAGPSSSAGRSFSMQSQASSGRSFGTAPAYRANSLPSQNRFQYSSPTGSAPFGSTIPYGERTGNQHRGQYRPNYRGGYLAPGWIGYGYGYGGYGYADDSNYGASEQEYAAPADTGSGEINADPGQYANYPPPARPAYQPEAAAAPVPDQPEVTLLFKDGRPPQQVQNYAVTPTTLYVFDGARRREIPLSQLDLPQTEKTNREAGIDFQIPTTAD